MMMSGEKDFLDEFAEQDAALEPVQQTIDRVEPAGSGSLRGPDGKFVRKEAAEKATQAETGAKEAAGMQQITEPPSDDEEGAQVPLSVVKALRKELQELKRSQGSTTQTQPKAPEFTGPQVAFEQDPQTYTQQSIHGLKMQMSSFMAAQMTSQETVAQAWAEFDKACYEDPVVSSYSKALVDHPHPMAEIVKWWQREQQLRTLNEAGSLEALIEQRIAAMQGGQPQVQTQGRPNVPPSLAGTGKPRTSDATGEPADGFDVLFKR
jgi:hypothetical protein